MGKLDDWDTGHLDPTAIDLRTDPLTQRMHGWTNHGGLEIDVPYMTKIADNLWQGGCRHGLKLPENISFVLSLYPWEEYTLHDGAERVEVRMYDDPSQTLERVDELARLVNEKRKEGEVLVHCQAGLNRSAIIAARAMFLDLDGNPKQNLSGSFIVEYLRETRSPAVLCNPAFEAEVMSWGR